MKKIFAIGDIHGMKNEVIYLLKNIEFSDEDKIIFLGDYIDRGYDSKGVIDFLLKFVREHPNTVFLKGNHEDMFLSFTEGDFDQRIYFYNGGEATLKSYNIPFCQYSYVKKYIPYEHIEFFNSLSLYYETKEYLFVHAGLLPGVPLSQQLPQDLLWIREKFIYSDYDFGKTVIFGHTVFDEPLIMKNKIGIDTGLVFGGKLTSIELPSMKIYQTGIIN